MAAVRVQATPRGNLDNEDLEAVSFASLPAAGSTIMVTVAVASTDPAFDLPAGAVTDNQGNTYSRATSIIHSGNPGAGIYYVHNIGAPSGTFTVTVNPSSATNYGSVMASEWTGLTNEAVDKVASATGTTASASSGATATTAQADELIVAAMATDQGGDAVSITVEVTSPVWVQEFEHLDWDTSNPGEADYKIVSAAAAYTANWTTDRSGEWAAVIATFKIAAAVGGAPPFFTTLDAQRI